ncbi:MAG: prepilin peptidase [Patescibacteria group bacterium]|nr:prepilin peptidase [Patescibacteria group bacterium]
MAIAKIFKLANIYIILVFYFLAGIIWGSFLGVIVERLIYQKNKWQLDLFSRSHCLSCGHQLGLIDLTPLFSFIVLKGKCRYCQKPISWIVFLVEIYSGILFISSYFAFGFNLNFIFAVVLGSVLGIILFYDLKANLVPDPLILILGLLFIVKLIFNLEPYFFDLSSFWQPILGALISASFFFLIHFLTRGRGMGLGDAKLGLVLGLFLGVKLSFFMLWLAFLIGAVFAIIMLILKLKKRTDTIAFAPFLVVAFLIIYFLPSLAEIISTLSL